MRRPDSKLPEAALGPLSGCEPPKEENAGRAHVRRIPLPEQTGSVPIRMQGHSAGTDGVSEPGKHSLRQKRREALPGEPLPQGRSGLQRRPPTKPLPAELRRGKPFPDKCRECDADEKRRAARQRSPG